MATRGQLQQKCTLKTLQITAANIHMANTPLNDYVHKYNIEP